jgi:CBS domain containing-hemolysin-like protein
MLDLVNALIALGLVLLNGFFVLAEFAIVKVRSTRIDEMAESGGANAKAAREVVSRLDSYLSATQLGITLASLALGWIGEPAFSHMFEGLFGLFGWTSRAASHGAAMVAAFLLITFLHILVGELAPKSIAIQHPEAAALFTARPLRLFHRIFAVPLAVMNGASRLILKWVGVPPASSAELTYSEEELRSILGASQERGGFSFHHLMLLENAFDFGDLRVRDVAVPLEKAAVLDPYLPWEENAAVIRERRLSRYPLRERGRGRVVGVAHVKGLLLDLLAGSAPDLRRQVKDVVRVQDDVLLEVALRRLQRAGEHMGVAVDASGTDTGIFTLEDVVEELIGDVRDEFERRGPTMLGDLLPEGAILVDPDVTTRRELIERLVECACRIAPPLPTAAVLDAVLKREAQVPTSIGEGVAVPHARLAGLEKPRLAFARLKEGLDFEAPDGRPVRLALLLLTPVEEPGAQLRLLSRTAGLMQSDYLRSRLLQAGGVAEILETFRVADTSAHV